jgi:hypothetical protein
MRIKTRGIFLLIVVVLLVAVGCGLEEITTDPNARFAHLTVEPEDARVVMKSMTASRIRTLSPPYDIDYVLRPYQATYLEISHKGYRSKIIKLDGTREEIHVKLEKLSEEELFLLKYKTGSAGRAGPSLNEIPGLGGTPGGGGGRGGSFGDFGDTSGEFQP